jgi:hypothetical protein
MQFLCGRSREQNRNGCSLGHVRRYALKTQSPLTWSFFKAGDKSNTAVTWIEPGEILQLKGSLVGSHAEEVL